MGITHAKVVAAADDGTSEVGSDEWNAGHQVDTITAIQDAQTPLSFTRFFANFVCSYDSYMQFSLQNKSGGTTASTDFVVTTDTGTDSAEYADFGINGSGYTGTWGASKDAYLYVDGGTTGIGNLVIGTQRSGTYVDIQIGGGAAANRVIRFDASGLLMTSVVDPATPAAGTMSFYSKKVCGRTLPKWKPPSGLDNAVQPALFQNSFFIVQPGTGTAPTVLGGSLTSVVTLSHPTVSSTTFGATTLFTSAATANATTGTGSALAPYCLTNASGYCGGFFMVQRLIWTDANYGTTSTGSRFFVGFTDQTMAASVGSDNPSGSRIGFSFSTNLSDTYWMLTTRNGTTETRVSTGMAFAVNKIYDFFLWSVAAASGNVVYWRIDNITDGTTFEGSTSATLPAVTTFMRVGFQLATLTTTARTMRMKKIYVETDL